MRGLPKRPLEALTQIAARHAGSSGTDTFTSRPTSHDTAIVRPRGQRRSISSASARMTAARSSWARSALGDERAQHPRVRMPIASQPYEPRHERDLLVREAVELRGQQHIGDMLVPIEEVEAPADVEHARAVIEGLRRVWDRRAARAPGTARPPSRAAGRPPRAASCRTARRATPARLPSRPPCDPISIFSRLSATPSRTPCPDTRIRVGAERTP